MMTREDGGVPAIRKFLLRAVRGFAVAVPLILCLAIPIGVHAQTQDASGAAYEFDVASIKPSAPSPGGPTMMSYQFTADGFTASNYTLMGLIRSAYGIDSNRISNAPEWLNDARYDIDARIDSSLVESLKALDPKQLDAARKHMLEELLTDRFKLTVHREMKELPVYTLVVAKNGSKLQESKPDDPGNTVSRNDDRRSGGGTPTAGAQRGGSGGTNGTRNWSGSGATIASLISSLSATLGRPVLDQTGLTGKYDYKLQWSPDDSQSESTAPSLLVALQEQLGLKLEAGKAPIEIIVIDHIEKPSGN